MAGRKKSTGKRRKRKLIVFIIELAVLALVLVGLFFYQKLNKINTRQLDDSKIDTNDVGEDTQVTFEGYTTIAVFGLDNRSEGTYSSGNSDVIMILNINNDTKEMSLVSVYRDTYLNVASADSDEYSFRKCNAAYARGGAEQAVTMLNRNLDLDIDNYVTVDFSAVADVVDILGGVEIEIESSKEAETINQYIAELNNVLDRDSDMIYSAGTYTMDGVQAVAYSRIRATSGGDFKRAQRQRLVFSKIVEKAKKANLTQIGEMIDTVFPKIETDLSKKEMLTMASAMLDYDMAYSIGFPVDKTTMTLGKVGAIDVPCTLESNVTWLHQQLFGTEDYEPSETVQEYSDYIIKQTGKSEDDAVSDDFSEADDFTGTDDSTDTESEDEEE